MWTGLSLNMHDHRNDPMMLYKFCSGHWDDGMRLVLQPFKVFGILAIVESQTIPAGSTNQKSIATARRPARAMETATMQSVIALCGRTRKPKYRMAKCVLLNALTDKILNLPDSGLASAEHGGLSASLILRMSAYKAALCVLTAPMRLLSTEVTVFQRFDWRSLQLNSRISPIFLPNLLLGLTGSLRLLSHRMTSKFMRQLWNFISIDRTISWRLCYPSVGLLVSAAALSGLICAEIIIEIIRVRTDLIVLNGDSAHSILPLDESHEGGFIQAAVDVPDYDVSNTFYRYAKLCTLPMLLVRGGLASIMLSLRHTLAQG